MTSRDQRLWAFSSQQVYLHSEGHEHQLRNEQKGNDKMKRLLKKYKKMKKSRLGRDSNLCLPDTSWAFYLLDNEETSSRFFVPVKEFDHN